MFAAVTAALVTAGDPQSLSCDSAKWKTSSGTLKCSTFGGRPNAIELADGGAWTHAYQELAVVPNATYRVSGEFYTLAAGACDGAARVRWCSPSVAVCPGNYTGVSCGSTPASGQRCVARRARRLRQRRGCSPHARQLGRPVGGAVPLTDGGVHCAADYYTTGGCYVGVAPLGQSANAWEPFDAMFVPSDSVVTVYINQEGTAYPSVVRGLAVLQRIGTRFPLAAPSLVLALPPMLTRPSPSVRSPSHPPATIPLGSTA